MSLLYSIWNLFDILTKKKIAFIHKQVCDNTKHKLFVAIKSVWWFDEMIDDITGTRYVIHYVIGSALTL